jgi:hypothetical protein
LAGFDNSGSNSNPNDELAKSSQNVKVAPRDMVLEFHPKDSVISEKINDQQRMLSKISGAVETPKTAGLRNVQPFQLNVPGAEESDQVASFNPSEGNESH